jgi:CheY-like chemotaxis protein
MRRALEKAHLLNPIQVVSDGVEAIQYLGGEGIYADRQQHPFPIMLLLDLRMPRKDGFEVLAWLQQQPGLKRLTKVVLTTSSEGPDINRAYDLGANSYLVKPPDADGLMDMLKRIQTYWLVLNHCPVCS